MEEERGPFRQEMHGNQNATSMFGNASVDASTHIHPPPVPSELPEHVWMIPYRHNTLFTGREDVLTRLYECFINDREAVLTQGQAINGLGGIGKTQVAVEYAYRHQEEYRFILWANASTEQTLIAAYISIADRLYLPERTIQDQEKIVAAVLHWLATHERWLLILDNADELEQVWSLLPTGSAGHMLLTTRDQMIGGMQNFLVEEMDRVEGTLLLLRRAHLLMPKMEVEQVAQRDRQIAEQIVEEMGGLPLALDQAGAYIEETKCSLAVYQKRYQRQQEALLNRRGRGERTYPASVATTWSLSFEYVEQKNSIAADVLRLCAYLAPDAIPDAIIMQGATSLGEHIQDMAEDQGNLDEATGVLRAYSLIRRDTQRNTWSVHRLVQVVIRESMMREVQHQWKQRVVEVVHAACPNVEDVRQWGACEQWVPHALVCAAWIEQEQIISPKAADLLNEAGNYLDKRARYAKAEPLYARALTIREQQLGPEHPNTASSLNNLAELYRKQGKYEQAKPLYARALTIREQQLGPEHPDTASSLNNLAGLYWNQGKYEQAEPLYQRALSILEQQLGPEHPNTAVSLNNLANLYSHGLRNEMTARKQ